MYQCGGQLQTTAPSDPAAVSIDDVMYQFEPDDSTEGLSSL